MWPAPGSLAWHQVLCTNPVLVESEELVQISAARVTYGGTMELAGLKMLK